MTTNTTRQPVTSMLRARQIERITRAEERAAVLHLAIEALKDDFKTHAREVLVVLQSLRDEAQQRKGADRERHWWTAAIVGLVTFIVNIAIKFV